MLKMEPDTIRGELKQILELITKWSNKLDDGVFGEEVPTRNDLDIEIFEVRLRGELQLAAERLLALVEIME